MDGGQDAGTSDETNDVSYADRGPDNIADLTRSDENSMDRTAQSGTTGAFGAGSETDSEQRREDAAAAFGGAVESGGAQHSHVDTAGGPTPGAGVSLGDVAGGSSDASGKAADDELAGAGGTGGGAGTSSAGVGGG